MTNREMKKCFASLVIREMQIKTRINHLHTSIRMAKIKGKENNKLIIPTNGKNAEQQELLHFPGWNADLVSSTQKTGNNLSVPHA